MSSRTKQLQARALERDRCVSSVALVLTEDATYLAAWLIGSLARGDHDEWSDVDLVVVVTDEHAVSAASDAVFALLGSVLSTREVKANAPEGGRFISVMYATAFGPIAVDWHWQPVSGAVVPAGARILFDKLGLPVSKFPHEELYPPRPYQPPEDPLEAAAAQVRFFWAMIPTTCKFLGRGWTPAVEDMIKMLKRSAGAVALFLGMPLDPSRGEPLSKMRELMNQMKRFADLLQAKGVRVDADVAMAEEAFAFVDDTGGDAGHAGVRERLAPERALATQGVLLEVNAQTGASWRLESRLALGMLGGAWAIHDGRRQAVLKWTDPNSSVPWNPDAADVVAYIRKSGYPTPEWLAHGVTSAGYLYSIQEFIPGEPLARLDLAAAEVILELVCLQRTLSPPTSLSWSSYMREHVFGEHESHETLAAAGGTIARALVEALEFARPYESDVLPDEEMVHCDLSISNILVHEGLLSGVIDIDAAGRGCAVYDVLSAAMNGVFWNADPDAVSRLHRFAFETYGPGPVCIAAATLVVEGLAFRLKSYPETAEGAASKSIEWIHQLRLMMR